MNPTLEGGPSYTRWQTSIEVEGGGRGEQGRKGSSVDGVRREGLGNKRAYALVSKNKYNVRREGLEGHFFLSHY